MEGQTDQFGIENIAYEQLQGEFQQILTNLTSDPTLDRFRIQYEKIHKALKHSHEQEKRLLGKCRELSKDIIAGSARLQAALRYSNDDTHTISYLKAEVAKTYKYLQLSKQQQDLSKQRIQKLKAELKSLHLMMEQNDSDREGQVAEIQQYTIANEELQKQKQILHISVQSNESQLEEIKAKILVNDNQKQEIKKQYGECIARKENQEKRVKDEEQGKKCKKDELEVIKEQYDRAKESQNRTRQKRKDLNIKYKEVTIRMHEVELNIEKNKKIMKKTEKQQAIDFKKLQQIKQINNSFNKYQKDRNQQNNQHNRIRKMIPVYQQNLQQKQSQIEAMKQDIESYEQAMCQLTIEWERLKKQEENYKTKFFFQKKRAQQERQEKKGQQDYIKVILPDKRFTGGGFNLAL